MKAKIHPPLYDVVFLDTASGGQFITTSTKKSDETMKIGGKEYFVIKVEVSSLSHPFYTGKRTLLDTAGRADKFMARLKKAGEIKEMELKKKKAKKGYDEDEEETAAETAKATKPAKAETAPAPETATEPAESQEAAVESADAQPEAKAPKAKKAATGETAAKKKPAAKAKASKA